jgi:ATP-binding cassette subfamily F protein uup
VNYDRYLEKRAETTAPVLETSKTLKESALPAAKPRKLKYKEARELETIEAVILTAEEEVARLEKEFAAPDFYLQAKDRWSAIETELAAARAKVANLYARWAELEKLQSLAESGS